MLDNIIQYCWQKFLSITHYDHFQWSDFGLLFLAVPYMLFNCIEAFIVGYSASSLQKLLTMECFCTKRFFLFPYRMPLIFISLLVLPSLLVLFYFAYGVIQKHFCLHLIDYITNPFLQFGLMLFVGDFKNYVRHYFASLWLVVGACINYIIRQQTLPC
jgi:hypothetical protein